jgi:hypothetical protein
MVCLLCGLYELYQYIHPSEVRTSLGSGMDHMMSLAQMFKDVLG